MPVDTGEKPIAPYVEFALVDKKRVFDVLLKDCCLVLLCTLIPHKILNLRKISADNDP